MQYSHLFYYCAFSRLTSTYQSKKVWLIITKKKKVIQKIKIITFLHHGCVAKKNDLNNSLIIFYDHFLLSKIFFFKSKKTKLYKKKVGIDRYLYFPDFFIF